MADKEHTSTVAATCHCGAVTLQLVAAPTQVTHCNCSMCRKYGVLWAYYPIADVAVDTTPTQTYTWGGKNVDSHRCAHCGCVTHWLPRSAQRDRMGINARLLAPEILDKAEVRFKDSAGTGLFH